MMKKKRDLYKKIFLSTLYLSTFTFGGGYVIVSLLKQKFVDELHWIEDDEMLDLVAIAQSSPGAIAVNGAIVVGYKLAGIPGTIFAVLGAVIPPMVILTAISSFYQFFKTNEYIKAVLRGMQAGVSAVIFSVVYDMTAEQVKKKDWINLLILAVTFVLNYFLKVNVIVILLGTAAVGILRILIEQYKEKRVK